MNDQPNMTNSEETPPPSTANAPAQVQPADQDTNRKLRESVEAAIGPEIGPEDRARVAERIIRTAAEFYRGPLPHPRHLRAYEDVCPGAATRIVTMAEKAQDRQENRLDRAIEYEYRDRKLGLILGFSALIANCALGGRVDRSCYRL
jgi:Predicted membrane protein (DUF2335)